MKLKQLLPSLFLLLFAFTALAQNQNPFASIGKKGKILTLTKGNYDEFFDKDSIQQIGSSLINIHTLKVVKLLTADESKKRLEGEKHSRFLSIDPHAHSYPFFSPYAAFNNSPIYYADSDGQDAIARIVVDDKGKKTMIITANYHYIIGDVSENVKKMVMKEFKDKGNRTGIKYKGENIAVKFEINFVEHKDTEKAVNANSSKADNVLIAAKLDPKLGDLSTSSVVSVNNGLFSQSVTLSDESTHIIPKDVAESEIANFIVHGIGHNIGFIHDENGEGVMDRTVGEFSVMEEKSSDGSGKKSARFNFYWDHISKKNVQDLVNKIDDMTTKKGEYWKGKEIENKQKKESDYGKKEKLEGSGITVIQ